MSFISPEGDLTKIFVDDYSMIDQFAGTGSLWVWGANATYGQLGDNTVIPKSSPVQTVSGGTNWKQVACGGLNHSAAIKTDGTLWTWGRSSLGQLGDNTVTLRSSPVQTVSGGTNWKLVSCGGYHTVAIKTDGTLWIWGRGEFGILGDNTEIQKSSPVQTVAGGNNWKLVSGGNIHTAAIKTDGTLWTWGYNLYGAVGTFTSRVSSPVQTVAGGNDWKSVSCGYHTAAIKTDGTLWVWGYNAYGGVGDNTITNRSSPVQTVAAGTDWKEVNCGSNHTAAIKTDGTLWMWGRGESGQLGNEAITHRSSPVQTVAGGTNWKQVACGVTHTAAIKTDGTLWTWGLASVGQLGNNGITSRSSPVQTISGGTNWKQVGGCNSSVAAVKFYDAGNL